MSPAITFSASVWACGRLGVSFGVSLCAQPLTILLQLREFLAVQTMLFLFSLELQTFFDWVIHDVIPAYCGFHVLTLSNDNLLRTVLSATCAQYALPPRLKGLLIAFNRAGVGSLIAQHQSSLAPDKSLSILNIAIFPISGTSSISTP